MDWEHKQKVCGEERTNTDHLQRRKYIKKLTLPGPFPTPPHRPEKPSPYY